MVVSIFVAVAIIIVHSVFPLYSNVSIWPWIPYSLTKLVLFPLMLSKTIRETWLDTWLFQFLLLLLLLLLLSLLCILSPTQL
jgi:hypothetical protein